MANPFNSLAGSYQLGLVHSVERDLEVKPVSMGKGWSSDVCCGWRTGKGSKSLSDLPSFSD